MEFTSLHAFSYCLEGNVGLLFVIVQDSCYIFKSPAVRSLFFWGGEGNQNFE